MNVSRACGFCCGVALMLLAAAAFLGLSAPAHAANFAKCVEGFWSSAKGAGISGDGRTIFFESDVDDFVPIDTNDETDIFAIPNPL